MAKPKKTAARRAKRIKLTPALIKRIGNSITTSQKVVWKELIGEFKIGVGSLAKAIRSLEKKGVVGPGGRGRARPVLVNKDGSRKSADEVKKLLETVPAKPRRKRRKSAAKSSVVAGAPVTNGVITDRQKMEFVQDLADSAGKSGKAILTAVVADLADLARYRPLLKKLGD